MQNKSLSALQFLFENYDSVVDVLAPNKAGMSTLSEAFNSGDPDVISACLEHPTSSEEKLLSKMDSKSNVDNKNQTASEDSTDGDDSKPYGAVDHVFNFDKEGVEGSKTVFLRELPISRADNPFGSESIPEDDTTGKGVRVFGH